MYPVGKTLLWNKITTTALSCLLLAFWLPCKVQAQNSNNALLMQVQAGISPLAVLQSHPSCSDFIQIAKDLYRVRIQQNQSLNNVLAEMNSDPRLLFAEVNANVQMPEEVASPFMMSFDINTDPTLYVSQGAYNQVDLGNIGGTAPGTSFSSLAGTPNATVTVAILDTGANLNHPDLQNRLVTGYNVLNPSSTPMEVQDGISNGAYGHGTMVAGIVARTSPHAVIMPVRVLNSDGVGTVANIITGIQYAVANGARVINMSFSGTYYSLALKNTLVAARNAGVVLVAAAGNDSSYVRHYPAAYAGVLSVASVNSNNILSSFSDFGDYVDVCAPGEQIRSTFVTGGYATWSGTSFATPFVSAEAAELAVRHTRWSANRIANLIMDTATPLDWQNFYYWGCLGAGLIDVQAAVFGDN